MSLRELFKGVHVAGSDSKHQRNGWINIKCPYCGKGSEHYHLGFHINHQYFHCWQCGKKPLFKTFDLILGIQHHELTNLLKNAKKGTLKRGFIEYNKPQKPFKIPPNVKSIKHLKAHKQYLKKRGFIWKELVDKYGIMGTSIISKLDDIDLSWRIFIPIYDDNEIVTWQTRSIGKTNVPYIACSKEREKVNIKNLLYPEEVSHTIFLVEGLFDCWKVRKAGFPGVCGFGVGLSPAQIRLLSNKRVIVFYDGDVAGVVESHKIQDRIEFINDKEVLIAECPEGKDPGDLSIKRIHKILRRFV